MILSNAQNWQFMLRKHDEKHNNDFSRCRTPTLPRAPGKQYAVRANPSLRCVGPSWMVHLTPTRKGGGIVEVIPPLQQGLLEQVLLDEGLLLTTYYLLVTGYCLLLTTSHYILLRAYCLLLTACTYCILLLLPITPSTRENRQRKSCKCMSAWVVCKARGNSKTNPSLQ